MNFTPRQLLILRAVLSYAGSNVDDINDAFTNYEGTFAIGDEETDPIADVEVLELWSLFGGH